MPDKNKVMVEYRGMRIQADVLAYEPLTGKESVIEIFIPEDNKLVVLRCKIDNVYRIPVQSATGEQFSYHIPFEYKMDVSDR